MSGAILVAGLVAGCGGAGPSACRPPTSSPVTLSGDDRRDPVVATDGGGNVVAVWESVIGGPVESSRRLTDGSWSPAAELSGDASRDPVVTVLPDGGALAAWQAPVDRSTVQVVVRRMDPGGTWGASQALSAEGSRAREPRLAVTADGTVIAAWRRETDGARGVVEVSEIQADGTWAVPRSVSQTAGRMRRPRLAVTPAGAAALVWTVETKPTDVIAAATRRPDGTWSTEQVISTGTRGAREPHVDVDRNGVAMAVWVAKDDTGPGTFAAPFDPADGWGAPVAVGRGTGMPREVSRPGRAETAPVVAFLPDGRAVAAWTLLDGRTTSVSAALFTGGTWSPARRVSGPGTPASGVSIAVTGGGQASLGWEEVDGGLLRARVARVTLDGDVSACSDLTAARTDSGGVYLARGTSGVAAFVDFNRGRIQVSQP